MINRELSDSVYKLENKYDEMKNLCGGILATLVLNKQRNNILFPTTEIEKSWEDAISNWRDKYKKIDISVPEKILSKEPLVPEEMKLFFKQHEADVIRDMFETIDREIMGKEIKKETNDKNINLTTR